MINLLCLLLLLYIYQASLDRLMRICISGPESFVSLHIPVKALIDSVDTYFPIFNDVINCSVRNGIFPEELKLAEVTPFLKKADPFDKVNYRPVSLLSYASKVYESFIFNQISIYLKPYSFAFLTCFRKNHNTQHSLLKMLELWKDPLVLSLWIYRIQNLDTLNHDLFIAKLENSLIYIQSYLRNRLERRNE